MYGTSCDVESADKRRCMTTDQVKVRNDTPVLSILINAAVIIGGLPALFVLTDKWSDSPQRLVAGGMGIVALGLFGFLRRKYDALLIALVLFSQFQISLLSIPLNAPAMLQIFFEDIVLVLFIMAALERREHVRLDIVGWLWFGLILWQMFAALSFSAHLHGSFIFLFWQVKYFIVYLLVQNMSLTEKLAQQIKTVVFLVLALQGGLAIAQLISGKTLGLMVFGEQDPSRLWDVNYVKGALRVSGTLGATNALAGYMATLLVFALPFLFLWQGVFRYACYGVGFVALLLPLSRAGWLSFMVGGGVVVGALLRAKIVKSTRVILIGMIGIVIIGTGAVLYLDRIQDRFEDKEAINSAKGRVDQFQEAWPAIERYPIFGIGAGVTEYYGRWHDNGRYVRNKLPGVNLGNQPHNSQLQYWIETGTPGVVLFAGIILMTFVTALQGPRESHRASELSLMRIGAGAAAVAAMVHASFGTEINNHQIMMAFWILFALARNDVNRQFSESEVEREGAA
jgi:O-antigen ligase